MMLEVRDAAAVAILFIFQRRGKGYFEHLRQARSAAGHTERTWMDDVPAETRADQAREPAGAPGTS